MIYVGVSAYLPNFKDNFRIKYFDTMYQWFEENNFTTHIYIDANQYTNNELELFKDNIIDDGILILNISKNAIRNMILKDKILSFDISKNKKIYRVNVKFDSIIYIYPKEMKAYEEMLNIDKEAINYYMGSQTSDLLTGSQISIINITSDSEVEIHTGVKFTKEEKKEQRIDEKPKSNIVSFEEYRQRKFNKNN